MSSGLLRTLAKRMRGQNHFSLSASLKRSTMFGFEIFSILLLPGKDGGLSGREKKYFKHKWPSSITPLSPDSCSWDSFSFCTGGATSRLPRLSNEPKVREELTLHKLGNNNRLEISDNIEMYYFAPIALFTGLVVALYGTTENSPITAKTIRRL